ncbi:helix-turn-helix domain-containing protein [Petrotoga sp. Shatin.DS.tank11.9.2.9.3]|uniref:helix-turn-helix domain-containing protein n=1 Tax=Petrotoga sp. Shatin.DS.tank11.9.2.9.3 TaxID=1469556 RepID=UPI000EF1DC70|nr:helix-turn-helix domain-containing protein [Petrotoga sp. Shatin.DS.tank11.9.2.9.3]
MRKELPKFFEQILNITEPWYIEKIEQQGNTINIYVDFKKGAKFEYNGKYYGAYDTVRRSWRHLNLFQYETYIHARVARIKTDDGTKTVEVPWARKNSGFTLLFEVFILELYNHMTVAEIAKKYNTTQNRFWRILDFYVSKDMSVPFKAGAKKHFPKAKIIFDKFHVLNVLIGQLYLFSLLPMVNLI